jgi:hypothetical protein
MTATEEPKSKKFKLEGQTLADTVRTNVFKALGKPDNMIRINLVNVYDNRWRMNIWRKLGESGGIVRSTISDSFFLQVDDQGGIISPVIEKKY